MTEPAPKKTFWRRFRRWMIVIVLIYAALLLVLVALSYGPQNAPFLYQIF